MLERINYTTIMEKKINEIVFLENVLLNFDSKLAIGILNGHKHFVRFTHCVESDIKFELRDAKLNTRKSNLLISREFLLRIFFFLF